MKTVMGLNKIIWEQLREIKTEMFAEKLHSLCWSVCLCVGLFSVSNSFFGLL